jgi:uncharacterized membrane protein SpoIIM required for sporulation
MDLDAYSAARRDEWDDLARLSAKRRFSGDEADDLIDRYQSGASDLSAIKSTLGSTQQGERLSLSLSRARLRFTGASTNAMSRLPAFFALQLPAALYRIRWVTLAVAAAVFLYAILDAVWLIQHPALLLNFGSEQMLRDYANQKFVNYYSAHGEGAFAGQVWTNNAWLAAQCIALGITGLWPLQVIYSVGAELGQGAAIMQQYGRLDHFFLYIAPHGQLELYSIFLAAAAGLMIAWAWIAPGGRTRAQALAEDGRALFTIVVGVILSLLISGLIEGIVTRQDWPWPIKIGIGTVALTVVLLYQWVIGRRAFRAGETGDLDEFEGGAKQIVAA